MRTALPSPNDESVLALGYSAARSVSMSSVRRYPRFFLHVSRFLGEDFLVDTQIEKD